MTSQAVQAQSPRNKIIAILVAMGLNVDQAVSQAIAALVSSSTHQPARLMENTVAIQELQLELDRAMLAALESGKLAAPEIRQASTIINISKDLGRLGKLAANLGRKVSQVGKHSEHEDFSRLQPLAIAVSHLCRQTLQSLTRMDMVLARTAAAAGPSVDAYRNYVLRGPSDPEVPAYDEQSVHLIFASRCLEQIADYTIDLAENLLLFFQSGPCLHPQPELKQRLAC
jgi:phosphate transport system protein